MVAGLALATLLCQAVAAVVSFLVLLGRLRKIPSGKWDYFSRPLLQTISTLAVTLMSSLTAMVPIPSSCPLRMLRLS